MGYDYRWSWMCLISSSVTCCFTISCHSHTSIVTAFTGHEKQSATIFWLLFICETSLTYSLIKEMWRCCLSNFSEICLLKALQRDMWPVNNSTFSLVFKVKLTGRPLVIPYRRWNIFAASAIIYWKIPIEISWFSIIYSIIRSVTDWYLFIFELE